MKSLTKITLMEVYMSRFKPEDKQMFTTMQKLIAVIAIIYLIAPDLLIGPIDDMLIAIIATITDVILGITKERLTIVPNPD